MMNLARVLMTTSAGLAFAFGAMHLLYTFPGSKLLPRDPAVQAAMAQTHPRITRETTVWRAWIGFNATHSIALLLFGSVFAFLALAHAELLFASAFLLTLGLAVLIAFVALAKLYFFTVPLVGISAALFCYAASIIASRA